MVIYQRVLAALLPALPAVIVLLFLGSAGPAHANSSPHSPDWDPACYRTNEGVQAFLQGVAATYPQIATLTDAGLSWEGTRHLWLLKLTSPNFGFRISD